MIEDTPDHTLAAHLGLSASQLALTLNRWILLYQNLQLQGELIRGAPAALQPDPQELQMFERLYT